ncbi:hypothetical protein SAMN05444008_13019 [Cnuella takakiae]|uniref:Uncharacterized protein n=1 Tax=Cnuella takakiae TaxID=1302690 RepID=A0A1M5JCT2_9BACT|nr:hypothetical protein BUE76_00470 [Cnuella takakiae]SHG38070.1 hypothetical protein SAMN05444008_13019 [Cnuella takakiae]
MCFPNTLSELDFSDSQLEESELQKAIEKFNEMWVDEVGQFQLSALNRSHCDVHECSLVDCMPKELQLRFREKYYKLYGRKGNAKGQICNGF